MFFLLAADQQVKQDYTKPSAAVYTMTVMVKEYYEGETKKTLTGSDAAAQDVKFIFPEEKKNKLQDGGIKLRYSQIKKTEAKMNFKFQRWYISQEN